MLNKLIAGAAMLCAICVIGCGGDGSSTSSNGTNSFVERIESTRVRPKLATVHVNDTVQFVNSDVNEHQVFSGTLDPQGNASVVHLITISSAGFSPIASTANLGDTVRFSNNSMNLNAFVMDILDDNGDVLTTITLPPGDSQEFAFPAAGIYTLRDENSLLFKGSITLFGRPNQNGLFQSGVLRNGDIFTKQFTTPGEFPFYVQNQADPTRSYITGTITAQ